MYSNIGECVQSCVECQKAKLDNHKKPTPLQPLPVLDVFRRVHMDILEPLKTSSAGYTHIILIVCSFSKHVEIFPLKSTCAKEIASIFYHEYICRYSALDVILTDRGTNFLSNIIKEICKIFEIKKINTSSYRPQTNSTCERNNKTMVEKIRTYIDDSQSNWSELLPSIAFAMNTSIYTESTNYSPYFILYGRECRTPIDTVLTEPTNSGPDAKQYVDKIHHKLRTARHIARQNIENAQEKYKIQHDKNAKEPHFAVRDKVWLDSKKHPVGLSPKLCNRWDGPYYIAEDRGN